MRFFNTGGPCNPEMHYMLPAKHRLDAYDVDRLIQQQHYFVVHAPRQVGKTAAMQMLACELTKSGNYISIVLSMETGAAFPDDTKSAELAILGSWKIAIRTQLPLELHPPIWVPETGGGGLISAFLSEWSFAASRPLVVFLDEIDALRDNVLISVLRQLRASYSHRSEPLTQGLKQLDDYMSGLSYHYLNETQAEVRTGWLVIFDQRSGQPPISERTTSETVTTPMGRTVTLIRA